MQRSAGHWWSISRGAREVACMREVSGRRPVVCATVVFSLRGCGDSLDRLFLDQCAGNLVMRRLPCQSREAGCRRALPYQLLDVRRAIAVVRVPRAISAIPFVVALWVRRPSRWTHVECLSQPGLKFRRRLNEHPDSPSPQPWLARLCRALLAIYSLISRARPIAARYSFLITTWT